MMAEAEPIYFFSLALGPHPQRVLTLMHSPRLCSASRLRSPDESASFGEARRSAGAKAAARHGRRRHHATYLPYLTLCSAAKSVFLSNIAIVNGPTPPGTGVSAPATPSTFG